MQTSTMLHRAFALLMLASIGILIAISLVSLAQNLGQSHSDSESTLVRIMNGQRQGLSPSQIDEIAPLHPSLVFVADSLALKDKRLKGIVRLSIPQSVQNEYVDTTKNNAPIFDCSGTFCVLKAGYASKQIQVQLITASSENGGESELSKNVTFGEIDASAFGRALIPVDVPLTGFPDLYPQDSYFLDIVMSFTLPNGIARLVNGKAPTGNQVDSYAVEPGNVSSSQDTTISPISNKAQLGEYHVSFKRPIRTVLYDYSVALIPLLFAVLFLHLLFFSQHFPHKIFEEFTEALLVVILAVLPLRVVLVPAELDSLTRIDLILGLGLVLVVSVAVGKYATEIWSGRQDDARAEVHAGE
jgi:hypothetical protein